MVRTMSWKSIEKLKGRISFVWLIAIAGLLVLVWYVFFYFQFKIDELPIFSSYESVRTFSKYIPEEINIEKDAEVLRNFSRVEGGGTLYSLLEIKSKTELSDSVEYYKALLGKNNWTVKVLEDEVLIKDIEGVKDGNRIIMNAHYDEQINSNVITIHFFDFNSSGE